MRGAEANLRKIDRQLLACLRAYRLGQPQAEYVALSKEAWVDLHTLASQQKLASVVYETLYRREDFCGGDTQLASGWKRETILQASAQTMRTGALLELCNRLEENGVVYAVVKGAVCRSLYKKPDLRISGDEDILIRREEFPRCREAFATCGMYLQGGTEQDDVTHWIHGPSGLHVELHTALFSSLRKEDAMLNDWFSESIHHAVPWEIPGGAVRTLPCRDHFLLLVCHALKHFIAGGFGIRTLCDIVTFAETYQNEIDWAYVCRKLLAVHGRLFLDQIFAVGQKYLGVDPAGCGWTMLQPPDEAALLEDCLDAGIYGQSSMSRRHSASLVLEAAEDGRNRLRLLRSVFPPRKKLVGKYPVLARWPFLLPAVWVYRLGGYGVEVIRTSGKESSPVQSISMGKKRTEMMIKYGIIPKKKGR